MKDSKRDKSHSEGSNRHIHDPVQEVLHSVKGQTLGNVSTNPPRSDELMEYFQKACQRGRNSKIFQEMEFTIIYTSNQKDKGLAQQKEGGKQGRLSSSFYWKSTSHTTSPRGKTNKKNNCRKPYSQSYRSSILQKNAL
ncbi:hypothetical protein O181_125641 [Austropuccinia psidii MF-1]|uniref:Uncharacterized protein n=1 Tax=Austropuccinia psidii MF-1 TaxID=1389203 RepID=A0A9Q3KTJ3_9BASI|nr:hypothetical protein [Austropuccinia psidii MF-1]